MALISLRMKKNIILSNVDGKTDPLQFAYQVVKGVEDTKLFILNNKHLETAQALLRLLSTDFISI